MTIKVESRLKILKSNRLVDTYYNIRTWDVDYTWYNEEK